MPRSTVRSDHQQMMDASIDEIIRFNRALAAGAQVFITTFSGTYRVSNCNADYWYHTPDANGGYGQSWAGCNDAQWADMLRQAGVARNPRWAK